MNEALAGADVRVAGRTATLSFPQPESDPCALAGAFAFMA
jgi:hypothetical protein